MSWISENKAEYLKARRLRLSEEGKCEDCGKKELMNNDSLCCLCREKRRAADRKYRQKLKTKGF
jgi:hypothetical protein